MYLLWWIQIRLFVWWLRDDKDCVSVSQLYIRIPRQTWWKLCVESDPSGLHRNARKEGLIVKVSKTLMGKLVVNTMILRDQSTTRLKAEIPIRDLSCKRSFVHSMTRQQCKSVNVHCASWNTLLAMFLGNLVTNHLIAVWNMFHVIKLCPSLDCKIDLFVSSPGESYESYWQLPTYFGSQWETNGFARW